MEDYDTDSYDFDDVTTWDIEVGNITAAAVNSTANVMGVEEPANVARVLVLVLGIGLAGLVVAKGGDWLIAVVLVAAPVILAGTQFRIYPFAFVATIGAIAALLLAYRLYLKLT